MMKLISTPFAEPKLPRIGNIRIGEKAIAKSGKEYPKATDYFICKSENKLIEQAFNSVYGEAPKRIDIFFTSENDVEQQYEMRDTGGKLIAKGDGSSFIFYEKGQKDGEVEEKIYGQDVIDNMGGIEEFLKRSAAKYKSKWDKVLRLNFVVLGMSQYLGSFKFETKAETANGIIESLQVVEKMSGGISKVVFEMSVKMHTSQKSGESKKYPVVSLVAKATTERLINSKGSNEMVLIN